MCPQSVLIAANIGLLVCGVTIAYAPNFMVFAIAKFVIGGFQQVSWGKKRCILL